MPFLHGTISPPGAGHQELLEILLGLVCLIHVPYAGITLASAASSLVLCLLGRGEKNGARARAGRTIGMLATFRPSAVFFLGIVPLATATLIDRQLLYASGIPVLGYQLKAVFLAAAGLICLSWYRHLLSTDRNAIEKAAGAGALGLLLLGAGYFMLSAAVARIIDPEKWPFVHGAVRLLLSWNGIAVFKIVTFTFLCAGGAGMLFFLCVWNRGGVNGTEQDRRFFIRLSSGVAFFAALILPVIWVYVLVTVPEASLSSGVFASAVFVLVSLMATALVAFRSLIDFRRGLGVAAFMVSLLVVLGTLSADHFARATALQEHSLALGAMAAEVEDSLLAAVEPHGGARTAASGEEIFKERCSVCHAFDHVVVGPPYDETVPAYKGDIAALRDFIANPVKKRPDFPQMPRLGLREAEIDSVAAYIMNRVAAE
jgi:cytochrome c